MKRRKFLQNSSMLAAAPLLVQSCNPSSDQQEAETQPVEEVFPLEELTIDELQRKMQSGELTARSITEMYLKRIEAIDKNGPTINSVIEINPDALSIADAMDEERKSGRIRSYMHGIPVLIKDNINTADKMQTTAGSLALEGNIASTDAHIVKQLWVSGAGL
jgi:amidase